MQHKLEGELLQQLRLHAGTLHNSKRQLWPRGLPRGERGPGARCQRAFAIAQLITTTVTDQFNINGLPAHCVPSTVCQAH
jgi:hypothetical protein